MILIDPPGAPRIDGYNEGEIIRENQSVSLTCISRGGNPSPGTELQKIIISYI